MSEGATPEIKNEQSIANKVGELLEKLGNKETFTRGQVESVLAVGILMGAGAYIAQSDHLKGMVDNELTTSSLHNLKDLEQGHAGIDGMTLDQAKQATVDLVKDQVSFEGGAAKFADSVAKLLGAPDVIRTENDAFLWRNVASPLAKLGTAVNRFILSPAGDALATVLAADGITAGVLAVKGKVQDRWNEKVPVSSHILPALGRFLKGNISSPKSV